METLVHAIDRIENAVGSGALSYQVLPLVPSVRDEVAAVRSAFSSTEAGESDAVRHYCGQATTSVYQIFDEFMMILEDFEMDAAEGRDLPGEPFVQAMKSAYTRLNSACLMFQQSALIARGPSSHSGVNLILNGLSRLSSGEDCITELAASLNREIMLASGAMDFLKSDDPVTEGMMEFYRCYRKLIEDIIGALAFPGMADIPFFIAELQRAGEYYRRIDVKYQVDAYWYSPTSLPSVNLVLNTGYNFAEGLGEKEIFRYFLEELKKLCQSAGSVHPSPSDPGYEEEQRMVQKQALAEMEEAITGLESFCTLGDRSLYDSSAGLLYGAALRYGHASALLTELGESRNRIMCLRCGFQNKAGEVLCSHCRALLPQVEDSSPSSFSTMAGNGIEEEPVMTAHVQDLLDSAGGLSDGTTEYHQFEEILRHMEERLALAVKGIVEVPLITPEVIEKMGSEAAASEYSKLSRASRLYREGLDMMAQSLSLFRDFSLSRSESRMKEAGEMIIQSMGLLQKAQAIVSKEYDMSQNEL